VVELNQLRKQCNTSRRMVVRAVNGVNLRVYKGETLGIVGESGCGKSTVARLLLGLEQPTSGDIYISGQAQMVFQDPASSFNPKMTIGAIVEEPLMVKGQGSKVERAQKVRQLISQVGLDPSYAERYPHQLSGGQRQRIAVARALAANPSVLLADEPTSALDPETTGSVLTVLDRARAELGVTVLVVTHDMGVVRKICDDVAVLEQGRVVEHGKVLDLVGDASSRTSSALLPAVDLNPINESSYDRVADVVLVGFAAVGALLPEASHRFGVELNIVGGGLTRLGETPVARFRLGLNGERSDSALEWIGEAGGAVQRSLKGPQGVAA
jgi:D-methionine transport system ATP-binding protein